MFDAADPSVPKPSRLSAAGRLAARHQEAELEERREAVRLLLKTPLIPGEGSTAEEFRLVSRNRHWLQRWFNRWPGWTLVVANDVARLRKYASPRFDMTRGLDETSGPERTPLTRRGYALLCLVLATLEQEHRQTTIRQVALRTETAARIDPELAEAGFRYDPKVQAHRRELVNVMRLLQRRNILVRIDRDDADFVRGEEGDCLYRIDRAALSTVLCSVHGASTVQATNVREFAALLNEVEMPDSADAKNRDLQHRLVRRLLDDPVMYFDELDEAEFDYFQSQGERLLRELSEVTGMAVERRAEGVALLDPAGEWTDLGLPETGTRGHATLLLAQWLADRLRQETAEECRVSVTQVRQHVAELAAEHRRHWRKGCDSPEGTRQLAAQALAVLRSLALVDIKSDRVIPRPAIARYRCLEVTEPQA